MSESNGGRFTGSLCTTAFKTQGNCMRCGSGPTGKQSTPCGGHHGGPPMQPDAAATTTEHVTFSEGFILQNNESIMQTVGGDF